MRHFTKKEIELVKENLKNQIPKSHFVEQILKADYRTFNRMCSEVGIDYPNFGRRKVNVNPFENLQDSNVQYWLGWLATDGCISHKESRVTLSVSIKDIDVVKKFKEFVSNKLIIKHTIHHGKFEMVSVSFRNKEITDFLLTLGFGEDKTFNFVPNFNISWDYIRGVFEGDGYFRWSHNKEVNITSACRKHIELICSFVKDSGINCLMREKITPKGTRMYDFEIYNKEGIIQFINNIYNDANTFMNRKYYNARAIRNNSWKDPKFGESASEIPSQASSEEGVTTLQDPLST